MPGKDKRKLSHTEHEEGRRELDRLVERAADGLKRGRPVEETLTADEAATLRARYCTFEDGRDAGGFLVDSALNVHKVSTPRPYLHLMGTTHSREHGSYGSFWDGSGSGFGCLDAVLAGPVTSHKDPSYVPTAPRATDHRHFYLREETADGVSIRHLFPQRGVEEEGYDSYLCRQGLGDLELRSSRDGIAARLRVFVPVDQPLEVWSLELLNGSDDSRELDLFSWVNWGLESYPAYYFDPRVVSEGRVYEDLHALVALNNDQNNKHPRTGFFLGDTAFEDFDMSSEEFTGGGHFRKFPRAVVRGECRGSIGLQPYLGLIAAARWRIELEPGESRRLNFLLGVTESEDEKCRVHLSGLIRYYFEEDGVERELDNLRKVWRGRVDSEKCLTVDSEFDRFYNVWSKYQAANTARWTRALDKVGYRDLLQDLMGINSFDPAYTRTMLPAALRHQLLDGRAVRQFAKFEGAPHDERMYMDSTSWIPDTLVGYIEQTGDFSILDLHEGYLDVQSGRVDRARSESVYQHALRGVRTLYEHRGLHGLCTIGHGDWNDALDGVGREGQGVSVWLSMALVYAARRLRALAVYRLDNEHIELLDRIIEEVTAAINDNAWDGGHYIYAFMPDGFPVGSDSNAEGKMHLNVNSWALFNGVAAAAGREQAVLEAIERARTPLGYLLITPGYTAASKHVGRIADMSPGQFENGSIYTHGQSFAAYAFACLGRGGDAWRALKTIWPDNTLPDISTGPPHQVSNFTVGIEHPHFGRNLYSNFSGSLPWLRKVVERILGLLPGLDGMAVDPSIPPEWKDYRVDKLWRGCRVRMKVRNPAGVSSGVKAAQLDGEDLPVADSRVWIDADRLIADTAVDLEVELG